MGSIKIIIAILLIFTLINYGMHVSIVKQDREIREKAIEIYNECIANNIETNPIPLGEDEIVEYNFTIP